ncbi:MAG: hydrolase [Firmicutes bacterium HGW-Firmicutes-15]|nr:MAG: hydrolase [Firmicutes bacterium HGW-Firmicutes-15]
MEKLNIIIKYLYHSGFCVETDKCLLVFDFYQGSLNLKNKKTYVFSSHIHPDHYNPEIFKWQNKQPQPSVQYILSNDICSVKDIPLTKDNITFISPYEEKQIDDINVKAYGSTDEGVSFLVRCDGVSIFHAGDLNWWYWEEETPAENIIAEKGFKEEIAKIKGESIDIAFFPVDPRLEQNYCLGAELFINEINPGYFIPMHFWDDHDVVRQFCTRMKDSATQVIQFTQRGQEVVI